MSNYSQDWVLNDQGIMVDRWTGIPKAHYEAARAPEPLSERLNKLLDSRSYKALEGLVGMYGWERIESAFKVMELERGQQ